MQRNPQPWITTGIGLLGAGLIAVTPAATPPPDVQHRQFRLTDYDESDLSQLVSTTEANWSGLETALGSSNWASDPDISQGLSTVLSDLSTGTSNAVTNPTSLLTEGALALLSSDYASNAASTALTAVTDNVESALSGGDYSGALTDLENGPTTVLDAYLNGYPETVGSGGLISPEFGLLTNTTDGAATGEIDALQQLSNTVADELSAVGGGNLTTGSLPEVTGTVDFSISLNQILSDLGLTSGGATLTVNGLLSDLGLSGTSSILPPDISLGTVLSDLGLSSSSDINVGQVLSDLGLSDSSGISLGTILGDLGLSAGSGIDVGAILSDLGLSDSSGISIPAISVGTILNDLDLSDTSSISIPAISVGTILNDLGLSDSSGISLGTALGDLGININGSFNADTLITDLVGDPTVNAGCVSILGHSECVSISLETLLSDAGLSNDQISLSSILSDLGINTNGGITLGDILSAFGLSDSNTITPPSIDIGDVLSTFGLSDSSTITPPSIDIGDVLSTFGLSDSSNIGLSQILSDLGLSDNSSIDVGEVLNALGLSDSSNIGLSQILSDLGLSDSSSISLPSISIDTILNDLGINPDSSLLADLGIPSTLTLSPTLDLTGSGVPTYDLDLAQDLLAALGSSQALSSDLSTLLTNDPTLDLTTLLSGLLTDLGVPATVTGGDLSADLTNIAAELLANF
jgi:hypothetical protein